MSATLRATEWGGGETHSGHGLDVVLESGRGAVGASARVLQVVLESCVSRVLARPGRVGEFTGEQSLSLKVPPQRIPQVLNSALHHWAESMVSFARDKVEGIPGEAGRAYF